MIWLLVAGLAATTYLVRLTGVYLAHRTAGEGSSQPGWVRLLPVTLLAAVVVTQAVPGGQIRPHLVAAALAAGLASRKFGFLPAMLIGGTVGIATALILRHL
jgi:uncharacterized membrane protein